MLFSSFSTRSMVFAYFAKAQLPFSLFRDLFNDTAEFTLCYGLHDCSHLFQGYFIHSLSTLYYYNAPSLATRLTGDYRDRTCTGKCGPASLDARHKNRSKRSHFYCILTLIIPIFTNFLTKYSYPILRTTACFTTHSAKTLVLFSYPPCLILRKFTFEGAAVNVQQICRDLIPPPLSSISNQYRYS